MMDHHENVTRAHAISAGEPTRRYVAYYRAQQYDRIGSVLASKPSARRWKITSRSIPVLLLPSFPRS